MKGVATDKLNEPTIVEKGKVICIQVTHGDQLIGGFAGLGCAGNLALAKTLALKREQRRVKTWRKVWPLRHCRPRHQAFETKGSLIMPSQSDVILGILELNEGLSPDTPSFAPRDGALVNPATFDRPVITEMVAGAF
ncbi:hypothetical protein [Mesorhizobium sp. M0408]|uniref:hypothetical protein n=1 Tax=Mesorhizobium sp. M0408 TaxID=2956942 RepID=UPI00333A9E1C